ncbi:MAG: hypothetical protein RML47_01690 [Bacteroidota bacterium]|nr:hypothetical protein [Rhodothermia bacterium]MCS7155214.1 hypothetical protein [Bacteroidota bacterium]MDW8138618.1 hypothetical protein [Bacteroidota bacterium]MDW8284796.1 hypothetical protein [Bacteroidota bacterium]
MRRSERVAGIYVTPQRVYAAVLSYQNGRIRVHRLESKPRAFSSMAQALATGDSQEQGARASGVGFLDLPSPLNSVAMELAESESSESLAYAPFIEQPGPSDIVVELRELLETEAFEHRLQVGFCITEPDLLLQELAIPADWDQERMEFRSLFRLLRERSDQPVSPDAVGFVPFKDRAVLAIMRMPTSPVLSSLNTLRELWGRRFPRVGLIDAEPTTLLGIARACHLMMADEVSFIVRVGLEETLVLALRGETLLRVESLKAVTIYDAPETICSRLLLLQDDEGLERVHNLYVLAEGGDSDRLRAQMEAYFPGAYVVPLSEGLSDMAIVLDEGVNPEHVEAYTIPIAVALRLITNDHALFYDVNLLPPDLERRPAQIELAWHGYALLLLLFVSTLFFVGRLHQQRLELRRWEEAVRSAAPLSPSLERELRARIDSLRALGLQYEAATQALDSLLLGSDRWSRALAQIAEATGVVGGIWIREWVPDKEHVDLSGYALDRDRIVALARRLDATIQAVTFDEIRGARVFQYHMRVPTPERLPRSVEYLRSLVNPEAERSAP